MSCRRHWLEGALTPYALVVVLVRVKVVPVHFELFANWTLVDQQEEARCKGGRLQARLGTLYGCSNEYHLLQLALELSRARFVRAQTKIPSSSGPRQ